MSVAGTARSFPAGQCKSPPAFIGNLDSDFSTRFLYRLQALPFVSVADLHKDNKSFHHMALIPKRLSRIEARNSQIVSNCPI
jgi:hypothetical protein